MTTPPEVSVLPVLGLHAPPEGSGVGLATAGAANGLTRGVGGTLVAVGRMVAAVAVDVGGGVAVAGTSVGVGSGGSAVAVAVGGTGVRVEVGSEVAVGVGGIGVGGIGVDVGVGVGVGIPMKTSVTFLNAPGSNICMGDRAVEGSPFRKNSMGRPISASSSGITTRLKKDCPSITAGSDSYPPTLTTSWASPGTGAPATTMVPEYTDGATVMGVGVGVGVGSAGNVRSKSSRSNMTLVRSVTK